MHLMEYKAVVFHFQFNNWIWQIVLKSIPASVLFNYVSLYLFDQILYVSLVLSIFAL